MVSIGYELLPQGTDVTGQPFRVLNTTTGVYGVVLGSSWLFHGLQSYISSDLWMSRIYASGHNIT